MRCRSEVKLLKLHGITRHFVITALTQTNTIPPSTLQNTTQTWRSAEKFLEEISVIQKKNIVQCFTGNRVTKLSLTGTVQLAIHNSAIILCTKFKSQTY